MLKKKNERKREFVEHQLQTISYIRILLGELRHVPVRTSECFDGTQIKYDSYGDIYFEILSTEKYLEEMKTQFIEELKSTRSPWKIKPVVGVIFEYDNDDKKIEMEIFIRSILMYLLIISLNHSQRHIMAQINKWEEAGLVLNLLAV